MADFGNGFDNLADEETAINTASVIAGMAAPSLVMSFIEGRESGSGNAIDLPDPAYGLAMAAGLYAVDMGGPTDMMAVGALGHAGLSVVENTALGEYLPDA